MDAHVVSSHLHSAAQQLQSLWGEIAGLKAMAGSEQRLSAAAAVAAEGAQRLAKATEDKAAEEEKVKAERIAGGGKGEGLVPAVVPAVIPAVEEPAGEVMVGEAQSKKDLAVAAEAAEAAAAAVQVAWVFNWRAGGWWAPGRFESETHDFGNGVTGTLALQAVHIHGGIPDRASRAGGLPEHSHQVGYGIQGIDKCKVHVAISLLDKDDAILRQIFEDGSVTAPVEHDFKSYEAWGEFFTPTAEEKVQSVRADGSIRLRAFVSLFLDGAA
ncbi:hypothetical protein T484DRAFT_3369091 [Baffinella frigidus]|nr:hypothetical protein T484DRAFT_3369091 [Cryptophyta sp. CCMP2293]